MELNKNKATYGSSSKGLTFWYYPKGKDKCTYISIYDENCPSIQLNYDVCMNTYRHIDAKPITKKLFFEKLAIVKDIINKIN